MGRIWRHSFLLIDVTVSGVHLNDNSPNPLHILNVYRADNKAQGLLGPNVWYFLTAKDTVNPMRKRLEDSRMASLSNAVIADLGQRKTRIMTQQGMYWSCLIGSFYSFFYSVMSYRLLADSVVGLHFCFILFVIFGALLIFKWRWVIWLHVPVLVWGISIMYIGWICPLTPLENWLREAAGGTGYEVGFIAHYLIPVIYPEGLTDWHQTVLGSLLVIFNLGMYGFLWHRHRQRLSRWILRWCPMKNAGYRLRIIAGVLPV